MKSTYQKASDQLGTRLEVIKLSPKAALFDICKNYHRIIFRSPFKQTLHINLYKDLLSRGLFIPAAGYKGAQ